MSEANRARVFRTAYQRERNIARKIAEADHKYWMFRHSYINRFPINNQEAIATMNREPGVLEGQLRYVIRTINNRNTKTNARAFLESLQTLRNLREQHQDALRAARNAARAYIGPHPEMGNNYAIISTAHRRLTRHETSKYSIKRIISERAFNPHTPYGRMRSMGENIRKIRTNNSLTNNNKKQQLHELWASQVGRTNKLTGLRGTNYQLSLLKKKIEHEIALINMNRMLRNAVASANKRKATLNILKNERWTKNQKTILKKKIYNLGLLNNNNLWEMLSPERKKQLLATSLSRR
jgi:hypothetical protein